MEEKQFVPPVTETMIKKPRKPRTPKVKPPKKERVALGPIFLVQPDGDSFVMVRTQPPSEVAHDINKVEQWASGQSELSGLKDVLMIRVYNATLKVTSAVKVSASIELIKKEVPQSNQTV